MTLLHKFFAKRLIPNLSHNKNLDMRIYTCFLIKVSASGCLSVFFFQ
ncbi:hypothetical protein FLAT13_02875 [Flavobacterium salmonis]|uniref:Uncharacterized protein n=1 Tax=Flavobacterium salmonis TaxID=2654844 RepID=A0A6V6Z1P9_9FLAO|nr:hypothetical protein FLAT13_02875 [Flavobacterium salmonis]